MSTSTQDENRTLRIEGLSPTTMHELFKRFPELKPVAEARGEEPSVGEDQELGTILLIISLVTAGLQTTTAILTFLREIKHRGRVVTTQPGPGGNVSETVVYAGDDASVHS